MGVIGPLFAYLVAHTPVETAGQRLQIAPDGLMVQAMLLGVVDGELILPACVFPWHDYSFRFW